MKFIQKYKVHLIAVVGFFVALLLMGKNKSLVNAKDFTKFEEKIRKEFGQREQKLQDSLTKIIQKSDAKLLDIESNLKQAIFQEQKNNLILSNELKKLKSIRYEKIDYSGISTDSLLNRLQSEN